MKKVLSLTLFVFFLQHALYAQTPDTKVNLSVGIGPNYGILGGKVVAGYKNSGFMLGLGTTFTGQLGYEIGGQYSYDHWFINAGYGVYKSVVYDFSGVVSSYALKGIIISTGGMINIGKQKLTFIELSGGVAFRTDDSPQPTTGYYYYYYSPVPEEPDINFTFNIGVGYRLGAK